MPEISQTSCECMWQIFLLQISCPSLAKDIIEMSTSQLQA